jgi:cytochrome c oxidase assembly factor CtaG
MYRPFRVGVGLGAAVVLAAAGVQVVEAHGHSAPEPTLPRILTAWSGELLPWIGLTAATVGYLVAVQIVNRSRRAPVARWRVTAWLAGVAAIGIALVSPIDLYSDQLFSVHMVQHLLLAMVAPALLALGAPTTLLLRASKSGFRRAVLLPILHSRIIKAISWPPVGWILFAAVMWATHFSPLFDAALEDRMVHDLEHLLYLLAGILFWWPVIGADPSRWRLRPVARMAYLAGQMPLNTAVGLAIYFAPSVLYAHYATLNRSWGPDPITDQQIAGIVMWGAGDLILLSALILAIAAWLRAEEKRSRAIEERAARHDEHALAESR